MTTLRSQIRRFWCEVSLPFPQPGIRLIRRQDVAAIDRRLQLYRQSLHEHVERLERVYHQLREEAQRRLGRLYRESDYLATIQGLFDLQWDYPNVEPQEYLARLAPPVYEADAAASRPASKRRCDSSKKPSPSNCGNWWNALWSG